MKLKRIKISEISIVSAASNREKFYIVKQGGDEIMDKDLNEMLTIFDLNVDGELPNDEIEKLEKIMRGLIYEKEAMSPNLIKTTTDLLKLYFEKVGVKKSEEIKFPSFNEAFAKISADENDTDEEILELRKQGVAFPSVAVLFRHGRK